MSSKTKPEQIRLTTSAAEALKKRVSLNELTASDIKIVTGLISFNIWLQNQLSRAKLSIHRLRQLFGFKTEKKSPDQMK